MTTEAEDRRTDSTEEDLEVARQLREVREESGLSRAEIADKLGISVTQVGRIERGDRATSVTTMIRWFRLCGYHLESVGVGEDPEAGAELARAVAGMGPEDLREVSRFARIWMRITHRERHALSSLIGAYESET